MPNAWARCATSTPTRPRPTMPSVLSCSSTPSHRVRFHSPARRSRSACGMLRACASSSAMVCSAAESTFDCGAFTTMTPRRVAASTSTLSSADAGPADDDELVGGFEHLGGDLGRAADHQRRRAPHRVEELARRESPRLHVDLEPGAAHGLEPAVGELLGDEDALHRVEARRSARGPERCPDDSTSRTARGYRVRNLAMRSTPSTRASSPRAKDSRA